MNVALDMTSALIRGIDPHTVPGMDGDVLRAGLDRELARFGEHGIDAAHDADRIG
jgi:hypothetical protein